MNEYLRLQDKMRVINYNIGVLRGEVDSLKDALSQNFCVDGEIAYSDEIENMVTNINNLKVSSKRDIIDDIYNYL